MAGILRKWFDFGESEMLLALMVLLPLFLIVGFLTAGYVGIREDASSHGLTVNFCGGEWSRVESGCSLSCSFSIVNDNVVPVTLDFFTWGWEPQGVCDDVDVSWDYDGRSVLPSEACDITMTLVGPSIRFAGDFLFYIDFVCSMS